MGNRFAQFKLVLLGMFADTGDERNHSLILLQESLLLERYTAHHVMLLPQYSPLTCDTRAR